MKPQPMSTAVRRELARPFPDHLVHTKPGSKGKGSYVAHGIVKQRMILVLGYAPNFEMVQIVRGDVAALEPNPQGESKRAKEGAPALHDVIVGVVCRMTLRDGSVTEDCGDCEQPHNWPTDGQRLKDAFSDGFKRCAAHFGVGLHLWSGDEYFLFRQLELGWHPAVATPSPSTANGGSVSAPAVSPPAPASPDNVSVPSAENVSAQRNPDGSTTVTFDEAQDQ